MMNDGWSRRMEAASEAARMAGKLLLNGLGEDLGTTSKGRNDFVTVMDVRSEELIKHHLHTLFPYDNFLGEEMGYEQYGDGGTWIIDPIDGTTNYIHGIPGYTISIAYEEKKWDPVMGVVYDPVLDELHAAQRNHGAFCNNVSIAVSPVVDVHQSVVMISPPLRKPERLSDYLGLFADICRNAGEVRDFGSAAGHLCHVAHGRGEAFIEFGLKYHDIAAGIVILKEAGGEVSSLDLTEKNEWMGNIIASNKALHSWFVEHAQFS